MIDKKTGNITLSATCQLKSGNALTDLFTLSLGESQAIADKENAWKWLTIKNGEVDGKYFIISLGFCKDALKQIDLLVSKERFDKTANWNSWSEQAELDILKELRGWLIDELGREGKFEWGEARASYDPKGGYSSISIHYYS